MSPDAVTNLDLRKQAWDYFELHASQRLTTFNFYVVISSLLTTGLLGTFQKDYKAPFLGVGLGLLLAFLSFVFWKLDHRNKQLIKNAEAALRHFETLAEPRDADSEPYITKVFLREEATTERIRSQNSWRLWKNHYSYSDCFDRVFLALGSVGTVGAILALVCQR